MIHGTAARFAFAFARSAASQFSSAVCESAGWDQYASESQKM